MPRNPKTQLPLFAQVLESAPQGAVGPAPAPEKLRALGARLPPRLYLGTSSWSYAGWRGIVYAESAPASRLSREGLPTYSAHPFLRTVGIDRTLYAPIGAGDFAAYAAQVPEAFRFLAKAHQACVRPAQGENRFLDSDYAIRSSIEPFAQGLGAKAGPLLFQFPPMNLARLGGAPRFAEQLHGFLKRLPKLGGDSFYAVEMRNKELLTADYRAALIDAEVAHCLNVHPGMPQVDVQYAAAGSERAPALVVRWMLNPNLRYETAKKRYEPFDELVDEAPATRALIAELTRNALAQNRPVFIIAGNKAEGSSPLTLEKLADEIVRRI